MLDILRCKFKYIKPLREKLITVPDEDLVEYNYWHDNYWGVCTCGGCDMALAQNKLGRMLQLIKREYS